MSFRSILPRLITGYIVFQLILRSSCSATTVSASDDRELNIVTIKFYNLKESKFDVDIYSELLAKKATSFCNNVSCGSPTSVTYTASDIINSNITKVSWNLGISTLVAYTNASTNISYPLPKAQLITILVNNREEFGDAVGREIIEIDTQVFRISADVKNNVILSLTFTFITLILLIAVLIIRKSNKDASRQKKAAAVRLEKRRMEKEGHYKLKAGPEPIERPTTQSHKSRSATREDKVSSHAALAPKSNVTRVDLEGGKTNGLYPVQMADSQEDSSLSSARLPPLNIDDVARREKKKKKKEKRRQREERQQGSEYDNTD